jgi:DNA-binding CsgD family transcriptional regulator
LRFVGASKSNLAPRKNGEFAAEKIVFQFLTCLFEKKGLDCFAPPDHQFVYPWLDKMGCKTAVVENGELRDPPSSGGFILLNSSMKPILVNRMAAEILSYPQTPETRESLDEFLAIKIRSTLFSRTRSGPAMVATFQSGRRFYQCRAYRVNSLADGDSQAFVAVLLERATRRSSSLLEVSEKFHLTAREQEIVQHLFEGRTTKEIAMQLEISPHTVKSFLHLIMVKMEVSTRSGIVGKALTTKP